MASDQLPGAIVRLYVKRAKGAAIPVFEGVNEFTGPGGSPEGVIATVKDNELPFMPMAATVAEGGDKIIATVELTTADGSDASDTVMNVPLRVLGKGMKMLSRTDFAYTVDYPAATAASVELPLGAGWTVPNGERVQVGGGKYFISIENDT